MSFYALNDKSFTLISFYTVKRIWERSIVSSIKPKFDNEFFVDLCVLYKLRKCFFNLQNWQKNFRFKSTKYQSSNFWLIEEIMDMSDILSAVTTCKKYLIKLKCGFIQTWAPMGTRAVKLRKKKVKVKSVFPALKLQDSSSLRIEFMGSKDLLW